MTSDVISNQLAAGDLDFPYLNSNFICFIFGQPYTCHVRFQIGRNRGDGTIFEYLRSIQNTKILAIHHSIKNESEPETSIKFLKINPLCLITHKNELFPGAMNRPIAQRIPHLKLPPNPNTKTYNYHRGGVEISFHKQKNCNKIGVMTAWMLSLRGALDASIGVNQPFAYI